MWELRHKYKVSALVKIAKLPRSSYYYYISAFEKADKYESVKAEIMRIYHENKGRYGYRRITLEMRNRGFIINHKTVQRLMRILKLVCRVRMKKYRSYKGKVGNIAPNLLERNFSANKPNEKWVTDVTEFSLFGKKLYLSPILDLYNGEIISYNLSCRPNFAQTVDMLNKAFDKIGDSTNLILHSDQGWQYQMKTYQQMLKDRNVIQSMSRKANCLDNAAIESFFAILKSELLYLMDFSSIEHFINELHEYLHYYNHYRIKTKLKGLSPVIYRTQAFSVA